MTIRIEENFLEDGFAFDKPLAKQLVSVHFHTPASYPPISFPSHIFDVDLTEE